MDIKEIRGRINAGEYEISFHAEKERYVVIVGTSLLNSVAILAFSP